MGPTSMSPDELQVTRSELFDQFIQLPTTQEIVRKGTFDAGHRVMNERMKCYNLHGHTYHYELKFSYTKAEDIGYAIDFKEIKRVGCQWIEDKLDHGMILNPEDHKVFLACDATNSKVWEMSLNGSGQYCNPTAENIAKEIFLAISFLLDKKHFHLYKVVLYETPNCYTECGMRSITKKELNNFMEKHKASLQRYKENKGTIEYDDRRVAA